MSTLINGDGVARIAAERQRQIEEEGYDKDHDAGHAHELALAAAVYALPPTSRKDENKYGIKFQYLLWPWDWEYFKPTPDNRIRELTKAGALIAAAIDSLLAEEED